MFEQSTNRLLQFLNSSFQTVGEACRTNLRQDASARARLSWSVREKGPTVRARLINISRAGAAVITAEPPPEATRVRLRLLGREQTPWIEAIVLGVEPIGRKRNRVRLQFIDPCPSYFLRVAVLGSIEPEPANAPPERQDRMTSQPF